MEGHKFPDGSSIAKLECKDGLWLPSKSTWITIPDCQGKKDSLKVLFAAVTAFNLCSNLQSSMSQRRKLPLFQRLPMSSGLQGTTVSIQYVQKFFLKKT